VPQLEIDSRPEAFSEVEKVVPKLLTAIDDAHFKVGGCSHRVLDPKGQDVDPKPSAPELPRLVALSAEP
jgi:hypothetical protein